MTKAYFISKDTVLQARYAFRACAALSIKIWSWCDSNTGYILHFNEYTGREANPDPIGEDGLAAQVVKTLMKYFENNDRILLGPVESPSRQKIFQHL